MKDPISHWSMFSILERWTPDTDTFHAVFKKNKKNCKQQTNWQVFCRLGINFHRVCRPEIKKKIDSNYRCDAHRFSCPDLVWTKLFLTHFVTFTGKHLQFITFIVRVLQPAALIKQRLHHGCFPTKFTKIFTTAIP